MTSNIWGSSICSPKSLYKKTSNGILAELKAVVKTSALTVSEAPTRPTPVCYDLCAMTGVCQTASSHPHSVTTERKGEEGRNKKMNFSSCRDHSWIKTTAIFSSLTFEFGYFFFCRLLSLQHKMLVLWYKMTLDELTCVKINQLINQLIYVTCHFRMRAIIGLHNFLPL